MFYITHHIKGHIISYTCKLYTHDTPGWSVIEGGGAVVGLGIAELVDGVRISVDGDAVGVLGPYLLCSI